MLHKLNIHHSISTNFYGSYQLSRNKKKLSFVVNSLEIILWKNAAMLLDFGKMCKINMKENLIILL